MEGILAVTFIFGGGSLFLLAISPVGRAIANRIQGAPGAASNQAVQRLEAEVEHLRQDVVEMQERLDFAERLLAQHREAPRMGSGHGGGDA